MAARYHIFTASYSLPITTGTGTHTFYPNPVTPGTVQVQGVQSDQAAWENVALWAESMSTGGPTFNWKVQFNGVDQATFATVTAAAGPKKVFTDPGPFPAAVSLTAVVQNVGASVIVVRLTWVGLCRNPNA